jgi:uncharacterized protein YlzI (FlbEa/FlbD family)
MKYELIGDIEKCRIVLYSPESRNKIVNISFPHLISYVFRDGEWVFNFENNIEYVEKIVDGVRTIEGKVIFTDEEKEEIINQVKNYDWLAQIKDILFDYDYIDGEFKKKNEYVKRSLLKYIKNLFKAAKPGIFCLNNWVNADEVALRNVQNLKEYMEINNIGNTQFRNFDNNFFFVSVSDLEEIKQSIVAFGLSWYERKWAVENQVKSGELTTEEEVKNALYLETDTIRFK